MSESLQNSINSSGIRELEISLEESELESLELRMRTRERETSSTLPLISLRLSLSKNSLLKNPENNKHFNDYILK
jgi:hypothetical protein